MASDIQQFPYFDSTDSNSFAYFTLTQRLPNIISQLIKTNDWLSPEQIKQLQDLSKDPLQQNISVQYVPPSDTAYWEIFFDTYTDHSWYSTPFFFVEAYFYLAILNICNYFETKRDPFFSIKCQNLQSNVKHMTRDATALQASMPTCSSTALHHFILYSLTGNSADLSQLNSEKSNIDIVIESNINTIYQHFISQEHFSIFLDNAFSELWSDLVLALHLSKAYPTKKISLHAKSYPTFVSDATAEDITYLLEHLQKLKQDPISSWAEELAAHIESGTINIHSSAFLNAPIHFTSPLMPATSHKGINIFKGDANYRRLFEDRRLPASALTESYLSKILSPVLLLRTLKSEIVTGLTPQKIHTLNSESPDWRTNGRKGIIQFIA